MNTCVLLSPLQQTFEQLEIESISEHRKAGLNSLIQYISDKIDAAESVQLNFICTHNSRRSQFAQCWAQVAAYVYKFPVDSFSGGVEVTACHLNTIEALRSNGFSILAHPGKNPNYELVYAADVDPIILFSKRFDDRINPKLDFAAVMTCGHADEHCPIIPGADIRIPITYVDPKQADGSPQEREVYLHKSLEIATEMKYIFYSLYHSIPN